MIERNRHAAGRLYNMGFGLACLIDGVVRILSMGFLHTHFPVEFSRIQAIHIRNIHARRTKKGLKK